MKAVPNEQEEIAVDSLLLLYERAVTPAIEREALAYLVWGVANPILEKEIGYRFRSNAKSGGLQLAIHQAEDVISEARVSLTRRLQQFRTNPALYGIANFRAYVRSVAENAFRAHVRQEKLHHADRRVAFEPELIESGSRGGGGSVIPGDGFTLGPVRHAEHWEFVKNLWEQVRSLERDPARIYLLGMREEKGTGDIRVFTESGVVGQRKIAQTLHVSEDWLDERWKDLPLSDREIALMVGFTPQQVSNKRDKIIALFARRLTAFMIVAS